MTAEHTLPPCPFCSSKNTEIANTSTPYFGVKCDDCGAEVHGQYFEGPVRRDKFSYTPDPKNVYEADYNGLYPEYRKAFDSAIVAWSRRAPDPENARLKERVAELEGLLLELCDPNTGMMEASIQASSEILQDRHGLPVRDENGRIVRYPTEMSEWLQDWLGRARAALAKAKGGA